MKYNEYMQRYIMCSYVNVCVKRNIVGTNNDIGNGDNDFGNCKNLMIMMVESNPW